MQIRGRFTVTVDPVDYEQTQLNFGVDTSLTAEDLAIQAALAKPNTCSMVNFCARYNHRIQFGFANRVEGNWSVTFFIKPCAAPAIEEAA